MIAVDPKFMILPWKEGSDEKPIIKGNQFPKMLNDLKEFFN